MEDKILVANGEAYRGNYVATSGWDSNKVVSFSKEAMTAYSLAQSKGIADPLIMYVPLKLETIL